MRIEQEKGPHNQASCKWIFDHDDFKTWRNCPHSRLLWIKGAAGKGKTMLLAGIIEMLPQKKQQDKSEVIAYFFCQRKENRINKATAVLEGLIYLLVTQQNALIEHLGDSQDPLDGAIAAFALSSILNKMLHDIEATVYLVVDALDECEETGLKQLLDQIVSIASQCNNVRWLVSSRDNSLIKERFKLVDSRARLEVELNVKTISPAVNIYIDHKVSGLECLKPHETALRDQVGSKIREKANATFLWVALVCLWLSLDSEELEDADGSRLLQMLDDVPPQLHHMATLTLLKLGYQQYQLFKKDHCKDYQRLETAITKYKEAISAADSSSPAYNTGIIKAYICLAECYRELSHRYRLSPSQKMDKIRKAEEYIAKAQLRAEETGDEALLQRIRFEKAVLSARRVLIEVKKPKVGDATKTLSGKLSSAKNELSTLKNEYEKVGNQTAVQWANYWSNMLDKAM